MPLEHILRAMQEQAESQIDKFIHSAEEEGAQLVAEAEEDAQQIRARHRARVEPMLLTQAASLQNKARLGALRAAANAREELLVAAFKQAEDCLVQLRRSPQYPAVFDALAREAAAGVSGDLVANVDPDDEALAHKTFVEIGIRAQVQCKSIPLGGLELMTRDGRVVIVNTLASRLEIARNRLRGPVAAILADQEKTEKEWTTSTAMPTPA